MKCAAGGGGDGDRIGGERVVLSFWNQRPEFIKSGLAEGREGSATVNFNINFRALTNWSLWAQGKDSIEDEGCGEKEEGRRNHTRL